MLQKALQSYGGMSRPAFLFTQSMNNLVECSILNSSADMRNTGIPTDIIPSLSFIS